MKSFIDFLKEAGNTAGGGAIGGLGSGSQEFGADPFDFSYEDISDADPDEEEEIVWPLFRRHIIEDIGNTAGSGAIAGIGVGPQGEPGVSPEDSHSDDEVASKYASVQEPVWPLKKVKNKKLKDLIDDLPDGVVNEDMFAGSEVFEVDSDIYQRCRLGKIRYHRWTKYVGDDEIGMKIRAYALENPNKNIIVRDRLTGAMMFLRHTSLPSFAAYTLGC